ncbi:hypothetical protein Tco_0217338 [Tanacetum coccineum]
MYLASAERSLRTLRTYLDLVELHQQFLCSLAIIYETRSHLNGTFLMDFIIFSLFSFPDREYSFKVVVKYLAFCYSDIKVPSLNKFKRAQTVAQPQPLQIDHLATRLDESKKQPAAKFSEQIAVKTINGEAQLHALVDGKKIIVTESSVRRDLQLADEEGVDCLPNSTIFEQLTLLGPKTTAWNEFSSTMASAIICLATNQKFNFSKFMVVNVPQSSDPIENVAMRLSFKAVVCWKMPRCTYGNKKYKTQGERVVIQELGESTTTISSQIIFTKNQMTKGKELLIETCEGYEEEDLIMLDEEATLKLQANLCWNSKRLAKREKLKKKSSYIALIETWGFDIQAMIC